MALRCTVAVIPMDTMASTKSDATSQFCVRFKQKSIDFLSETSLHGAKNVVNRKQHIVRRFLWAVLVIGLSVWMLITLYNEVKIYLEYSVNTIISVKFTTSIAFPAVTLCNYNRYRKSVIGGTPVDELMTKMFSSGQLDPNPKVNFDWSLLENSTAMTNRTVFELEAAHQKEHLIQSCVFTGGVSEMYCGLENFTAVFTQFGVCYTFNNDPDNQLKVYEIGSTTGLRLRLYTQEDEYTYGLRTGSGFKIILHEPGDVPLVNRLGFAIPTGVEALVSVNMKKTISLEAPYKTKCNRKPLLYWKEYSYVMCCLAKLTESVVTLCGCKEPYMPGPAEVCSLRVSVECVIPNIDAMSHKSFQLCQNGCEETFYTSRITYANFPSKAFMDVFTKKYNITKEYLKDNYADVAVFAEDLSYELTEFVPTMTLQSLWSNFGGFMGLGLGASMVTIVEFIDFFLFCGCKRS